MKGRTVPLLRPVTLIPWKDKREALAKDFLDHNFDIRYIERAILNSRTYQLTSKTNETNRLDKINYAHSYIRPLMAEAVDRHADFAIITSDNPRKEDPDAIIAEVEKGFRSTHYEKVSDRAEAIRRAIALAESRDIVLIAGKGHENYQEFADHTVPFDDIQVARRALEDRPMEFK